MARLNALGHDIQVRAAPEVFDGLFPSTKELGEMFQYFEVHTNLGPDAQIAIAAANTLGPSGFTTICEWRARI